MMMCPLPPPPIRKEFRTGIKGNRGSHSAPMGDLPEPEELQGPDAILATSSSFLDEAVAEASLASTQDDYKAHQELLRRMAQNLSLKMEEIEDSALALVDILSSPGSSTVALSLNEAISKPLKTSWQTPATLQPTVKWVERKYFIPPKEYEYLYTHPPPGSLVVGAVNDWERLGQQGPSPKAREAKKMDLLGRKVYPTGRPSVESGQPPGPAKSL